MLSEQELETFETLGAAVMVLDHRGHVVHWNHACAELSGLSLDEARGRPPWLLLAPAADAHRLEQAFEELRRKAAAALAAPGGRSRVEERWVQRLGDRWLSWVGTATHGPDGQIEMVVACGVDVTEQKRAEEQLATSNGFFHNVLTSATETGIIATDLSGRILLWNEGARRLSGYEASEVVGRSSDMLYDPEEIASGAVRVLHARALEIGRADGRLLRRRKDGTRFLARMVVTRREEADGSPTGYLVTCHDITDEQRRSDEQRFLSRLGEILMSSPDEHEAMDRVATTVVAFMADVFAIITAQPTGALRLHTLTHTDQERAKLADALRKLPPPTVPTHPVRSVLETLCPLLVPRVTDADLRALGGDDPEHLRTLDSLGLRSMMLVPMVARTRPQGLMGFASCREDRVYGNADLALAVEVSRRVALALENAALYAQRSQP